MVHKEQITFSDKFHADMTGHCFIALRTFSDCAAMANRPYQQEHFHSNVLQSPNSLSAFNRLVRTQFKRDFPIVYNLVTVHYWCQSNHDEAASYSEKDQLHPSASRDPPNHRVNTSSWVKTTWSDLQRRKSPRHTHNKLKWDTSCVRSRDSGRCSTACNDRPMGEIRDRV